MNILIYIVIITISNLSVGLSAQTHVVTFISPRTQSFNAERILVGWENYIHQRQAQLYGIYAAVPQVTSSFRPERINQCLFGDSIIRDFNTTTEWNDYITISGSQISERSSHDWLADNFGLPSDFKSITQYTPHVLNWVFDTQFFFGLNTILPGLYLQCELPLVYTHWDLNMRECILEPGHNNQFLHSFSEYVSGCIQDISNMPFSPLLYARMDPQPHTLITFSELRATIGYDYFPTYFHYFGVGLQIAIPCGNRPKGELLFEPIVGNGHHFECGIELSARFRTWTSETEDAHTDLFFNATVTHLFTTRQKRSFDIVNRPNSRYILAEQITQPTSQEIPLVNLTTKNVHVSINAQADISFLYAYTKNRDTWSFGYSLWKRGCEKICLRDSFNFNNEWQLKDGTVFTSEDIALHSAATSGFSQKIITHFNHAIATQSYNKPYIGLGAEVEFGRQAGPTPVIGSDVCINCALSQWGVWIKTGVVF